MSILWCGTFGQTLMAVSDDIDPPTDKRLTRSAATTPGPGITSGFMIVLP
jgi:hypothetical protein